MTNAPDIDPARVYDDGRATRGARLLVDRVWPRGIGKGELELDDWIREVAPSTALRKWFGHDPDTPPREAIAWDDDVPRLRFSTDSPRRTTTGDLEAMALYAGQGVGWITDVVPAGDRLRRMADEAAALLAQVRSDAAKGSG